MKTVARQLAFFTVCAFIFSCSKSQEKDIEQWNGSCVNISVGVATKTVLAGLVPTWSANDVLTVFDQDGTPVEFVNSTGAGTTATFSTTSWTGKVPICAVYSNAPTYDVTTGTAGVTVPSVQQAPAGSFASGANPSVGQVSLNGGEYTVATMKNVAALLSFTFTGDVDVLSLKIEGGDGEQIAGTANVAYPSMNWVASASPATEVVLTPQGGTFTGGVTYYAVLLPGTYSKGLKFTIIDANGESRIKEVGKELGMELLRGHVCAFQNIDAVPARPPKPAPAEFVVSLNLAESWPFNEAISSSAVDYTYEYSDDLSLTFAFEGAFNYSSGLNFTTEGGKLILPKVSGRYLNSVVIVHEKGSQKRIELHKIDGDSLIGNQYKTHVWKQPVPVAKFTAHTLDQCYLSLVDPINITHIYLFYNSVANGSDAVKLGFESQYNPYNNYNGEGDGATYVLDVVNGTSKSPFVGINYTASNTWDVNSIPEPYTFTQTVDGVAYTFESIRPDGWAGQHLFCWSSGMRSCNWGTPNLLKLPRTGKLVWVGAVCGNAYNASKNRSFSILSKDHQDTEYVIVGETAFLATSAQGTGDGTTLGNSAIYKAWCLEDEYSPTKDYYLSAGAGNTYINFFVLIYL